MCWTLGSPCRRDCQLLSWPGWFGEMYLRALPEIFFKSVRCLVETREGDNTMGVWIQPEDEQGRVAEEVDQKKVGPISYIWVTINNSIDDARVSSSDAVASGSDKCTSKMLSRSQQAENIPGTLNYTISHSSQSQAQLQKSYRSALERRNMAMFLPTGVSASEYIQTWQKIDYGDSGSQSATKDVETESSPANDAPPRRKFVPPHSFIKMLRGMARKGRSTSPGDDADQSAAWSFSAESWDTTLVCMLDTLLLVSLNPLAAGDTTI